MRLARAFRIWFILAALPLLAACQTMSSRVSPAVADELSRAGFSEYSNIPSNFSNMVFDTGSNFSIKSFFICNLPKCKDAEIILFADANFNNKISDNSFENLIKSNYYTNDKLKKDFKKIIANDTKNKDNVLSLTINKEFAYIYYDITSTEVGRPKIMSSIVKFSGNTGIGIFVFGNTVSSTRKYASARYLR